MSALELLARIQAAVAKPAADKPDGWEMESYYAKQFGVTDSTARKLLVGAVRAGIMERMKFKPQGYRNPIYLYRETPRKKAR